MLEAVKISPVLTYSILINTMDIISPTTTSITATDPTGTKITDLIDMKSASFHMKALKIILLERTTTATGEYLISGSQEPEKESRKIIPLLHLIMTPGILVTLTGIPTGSRQSYFTFSKKCIALVVKGLVRLMNTAVMMVCSHREYGKSSIEFQYDGGFQRDCCRLKD